MVGKSKAECVSGPTRSAFLETLIAFCLGVLLLLTGPAARAESAGGYDTIIAAPSQIVSDASLDALDASIRKVYQARPDASKKVAGGDVAVVNQLAREAADDEATAKDMVARLTPYETIYKNLLDIMGAAPPKDAPPEPQALTRQRERLLQAQHDLHSRLVRARLYSVEAQQLTSVLNQKTNAVQQAALLERFPAPIAPTFWSLVASESRQTKQSVQTLSGEITQLFQQGMTGESITLLLGGLIGAVLIAAAPFLLLSPIKRGVSRVLPAGRLRRVTAAVVFSAGSALCAGVSVSLLWFGLTGNVDTLGVGLDHFAEKIGAQIPLVGFILGASLFLFAARDKEWRIAPVSDEAARALQSSAIWFALLLILRGALRYVDLDANLGPNTIQLADCVFILAASPLLFSIPVQLMRHPLTDTGQSGVHQGLVGQAGRFLAVIVSLFCVGAMVIGYIPLGYTTLSWICSMAVTMLMLALIFLVVDDLTRGEFLTTGRMGRYFVMLGVSTRIVNQALTVVSGLLSVFLIFVAFAVAQSGGDFDFGVIVGNLNNVVFGQKIGGVTLSFGVILQCIAIPIFAHYIIKGMQRWLRKRLFPTTTLDLGAQTSIIAILTYAAWIAVILIVLSVIGVTVSSMTWVVSALSVGIGFGLQSIVQNFVSGLILLAERPVTIGDMVEIAGKTGDIRRISVRATDIALSDGSTLIVPNSQFITSAVRNATFGRPSGALSFTVGLPLGTDLAKAMSVLSPVLKEVPELLSDPAPSVSVADIQSDKVILKVSGKTSSPRTVDAVTNTTRLAVWSALNRNGIVASMESNG
ncbi:mechanosensitive ion channel domain-containing protein [Acetobacter sp.]|uniref:mechanosensitive ion channel domain-containing protein n=1 Tax=Acetobacter sp. TaxID=440 RepID=UPI0039EA9E70